MLLLIACDHVAALIGAGDGPETLPATAFAERHRVPLPFSTPRRPVTGRELNFVVPPPRWRVTKTKAFAQFLTALKAQGTVALVFEDSNSGRRRKIALAGVPIAGFAVAESLSGERNRPVRDRPNPRS